MAAVGGFRMSIGLGIGLSFTRSRAETPFNPLSLFASGEDGALYSFSEHNGDFDPTLLFASGEDGALYSFSEHNGDA